MTKEEYQKIERYMLQEMQDIDFSHGPQHVYRVLHHALEIAKSAAPDCDLDILIAACLLHDIGRKEQNQDIHLCHATIGSEKAYSFLLSIGWEERKALEVKKAIFAHRSRKGRTIDSEEGRILFDADKLDSLGCIGISRMLHYGGKIGEPFYRLSEEKELLTAPSLEEISSFLQEFNLKGGAVPNLHTEYAREKAAQLLAAAQPFYDQLLAELSQYVNSPTVEAYLDESNR